MFLNLLFNISFCDVAERWQLGIQDPATPTMEGILNFHNYIMIFLITIGCIVLWMLFKVVINFNDKDHPIPQKFTHSSALEIIWTILPAIILIIISIPSFGLLYSLDEVIDPTITLKIIGHQWYWSYEYSDYATLEGGETINFDSYLIATSDLTIGSFRLLEVDNKAMLPINTHTRLLVTAADVLHCWTVPSFGIKIDACPGRLSQSSLFIKREGTYYGQCSEICGVNHGFMPISVVGATTDQFVDWLAKKSDSLVLNSSGYRKIDSSLLATSKKKPKGFNFHGWGKDNPGKFCILIGLVVTVPYLISVTIDYYSNGSEIDEE